MDTVTFFIRGLDKFSIEHWAVFYPEFSQRSYSDLSFKEREMANNRRVPYVRKFVLHPEKSDDKHLPKVELFEKANTVTRTLTYEIKISTSLPKSIFTNSLQEIDLVDYHLILNTSVERLRQVGISLTSQTIASATPSVIHFCKNVFLPEKYPILAIQNELAMIDVGKAYDNSKDTHKRDTNQGAAVRLRCGAREWIFYDKIAEMFRPKSKSAEKDRMTHEQDLIETLNLKSFEVFRYEYRINKAQTIRSEINPLLGRSYDTPLTFADLFTEGLWQKVLSTAWKRIIERPDNQPVLIKADNDLDLLLRILKNAKEEDQSGHSQNKALWSYGLALAIRKHGAKTIRREMEKVWSDKADARLDEKLEIAARLLKGLPLDDGIVFIGQELEKFEQITLDKLKSYQLDM